MTEIEKVKNILEPLTFIEAYLWLEKNGVSDDIEYNDGIRIMYCLNDYPDVCVYISFDIYENKFSISLGYMEEFEPTVEINYDR